MSEQEPMYPAATRDVAERRRGLAPKPAEAFKAFSQRYPHDSSEASV